MFSEKFTDSTVPQCTQIHTPVQNVETAPLQIATIDKEGKKIKTCGCRNLEAGEKIAKMNSVIFEDELEIMHSFVRGIPTHSLSQFTLPGEVAPFYHLEMGIVGRGVIEVMFKLNVQ